MNLVIIDSANKKYHPFISAGGALESFIMGNVNAANLKNGTFLTVQMGVDLNLLDEHGYIMDQGIHDRLVLNYNNDLSPGQAPLELWKREL